MESKMPYSKRGMAEIRAIARNEWPPQSKGELANSLTELLENYDELRRLAQAVVDARTNGDRMDSVQALRDYLASKGDERG